MNYLWIAAAPVVAAVLAACGATGPKFNVADLPKGESSAIYVYRPAKFVSGGFSPLLAIDDHVLSKISNGSFIRKDVEAGSHKIELRPPSDGYGNFKTRTLDVSTTAGRITFVRFQIEAKNPRFSNAPFAVIPSGIMVPMLIPVTEYNLIPVESREALEEMKETRAIE